MKFKLLLLSIMFFMSLSVTALDKELNLENPDVRKCLIQAAASEGWMLSSSEYNQNKKLVMVFKKNNEERVYVSK